VGTRSFARRLGYEQQHAEHVRELSIQLFDQLQAVHHMQAHSRVLLEASALLHDVGHMISHRGHHKHGEYLALNGDIPGLEGRGRAVVAALVRYHNRKSEPGGHHPAYAALEDADKPIARRLAAILRIAEALDHSHRQRVMKIRASFQSGAVGLQVHARGDAAEDLKDANRSAELFEKEFHVKVYFRQVPAGLKPKLKAGSEKKGREFYQWSCAALILAIHSEGIMKLYIVRHGIAIDREDPKCPPDPERYLTEEGVEKTKQVAKGVAALGVIADLFLTSPYVRAAQTRKSSRVRSTTLSRESGGRICLLPGAEPSQLFRELVKQKQASTVFLFGHAPQLDDVIATALGSKETPYSPEEGGSSIFGTQATLAPDWRTHLAGDSEVTAAVGEMNRSG